MSSATFKIVLLGEGRVGKTSLVSRFVNDAFSDTEASTVQAGMYNKLKIEVEGTPISVCIVDTAGQERYHALGPIYYRNSHGAVLVYDITDADTFERCKMWLKELRSVVGDNIQIVLCGNKCDLERDRDIPAEIPAQWAASQGALHFTTSARANTNVGEAFTALCAAIVRANVDDGGGAGAGDGTTSSASSSRSRRRGAGGGSLAGSAVRPKRRGVKIDVDGNGDDVADTSATAAAAATAQGTSADGSFLPDDLGRDGGVLGDSPWATHAPTSSSSSAHAPASGTERQSKRVTLTEQKSGKQQAQQKTKKKGRCCD